MHVVGLVLHPERDCGGAVASVLDWADRRGIEVLGIDTELNRLACSANPVPAEELQKRADLLVSMGGDGTMLRAMRLADGQRFPVLGVNLGKLGFLAVVGARRWTGTEDFHGTDMFWDHAGTDSYLGWLEAARLTPLWDRFVPEGRSGHSLILAQAS